MMGVFHEGEVADGVAAADALVENVEGAAGSVACVCCSTVVSPTREMREEDRLLNPHTL